MNEKVSIMISYFTVLGIFLILTFLFVKMYCAYSLEKRIKDFSLKDKREEESIFDKIAIVFKRLLSRIAMHLEKRNILKMYVSFFDKYLIYAQDIIMPYEYLTLKFIMSVGISVIYLIGFLLNLVAFSMINILLIFTVVFLISDISTIIIYKLKKKYIEEQLLQAVVIMNSAFKSGKNIHDAICIVKDELPSPIKEEFEIIYKDISYGLSIENAFLRFEKRIKLEEAKYITASLSLLSKTGGNIVNVFNMIEKNFYDRMRIKNELNALTSSSKYLFRILIALPVFFVLVILMLNPTYFESLYQNVVGYILIGVMLVLYILYIIIVKKTLYVEEV